ncbi:MAG: hypothetical protein U1E06_06170 [Tabrizicola sp.]|nr:hypothetical protein [Tabrizicola sp.]
MADANPGREIWSSDLKASLSKVAERYDGKYAMEPVYRFEISLNAHPVPLVAEAVVSAFTGVAIAKMAEKAVIKKHFGAGYSRFRNQQVLEHGIWRRCKELTLPWPNLTENETLRARTAFSHLYFELECRWHEPVKGNSGFPPQAGPYQMVNLDFSPGGLLFQYHTIITTRDMLK